MSLMGTQDVGTGTRTCIHQVAADTFGIPMSLVQVMIGSSQFPQAEGSINSSTIGGVAGSVRKVSLQAAWKIFDLVGQKLQVDAKQLELRDGKIWSGDREVCSWVEATSLVGPMSLELLGDPVNESDELTGSQVGGVQMAEVSVDVETGIVRVLKMVAVQDMGLIVNPLLAKSQIQSGLIMGLSNALFEERIFSQRTGQLMNANTVDYRIPRLGDIGELVVELYQPEAQYQRGVIGVADPPMISPAAAISNAVANAIGVRVPGLPLTPQRVLDALKGVSR